MATRSIGDEPESQAVGPTEGGYLTARLLAVLRRGRTRPAWQRGAWLVAFAALLYLVTALVGSDMVVLLHLYYLAVLLSAVWFGVLVTALVALAVGILGGPLAPPGLLPDTHADLAWLARSGFYLTVGVLAAATIHELHHRRERMQYLYQDLLRLYGATLRGLVAALEMKDEETKAHCERVALNARRTGRALSVSEEDCTALYWAGYLHDVGKLATPSQILAKPAALSDEERLEVERHAERGEALLLGVSVAFAALAQGVRCHHERWDGGGYPDGLAGEAIPLFGRILAVVDVFEALTSVRPYRDAWSEEDAAALLSQEAGAHFDPTVVEAFLDLWRQDLLHVEGRHGAHAQVEEQVPFDPNILTGRSGPR